MEIEMISVLEGIEKGNFQASLITTYNAYLPFYENVVLKRLISNGCRYNVLMMDAYQLNEALKNPSLCPKQAGFQYSLVPIRATGAFHPKIILLLSDKKVRLFVGSHNVTLSGFGNNRELTTKIDTSKDQDPDGRVVVSTAWNFVQSWLEYQSDYLKPLKNAVVKLKDFSKIITNADLELLNPDFEFLGAQPDGPSLWELLKSRFSSPVVKVFILGPFFDSRYDFVRTLYKDLVPAEIIIGVEPDRVEMIPDIPGDIPNLRFINTSELTEKKGYLHAKCLLFETDNGNRWLVTGSANPSRPAWTGPPSIRNAEAVIVEHLSQQNSVFESLKFDKIPELPSLSNKDWEDIRNRLNTAPETDGDEPTSQHIISISVAIYSDYSFVFNRGLFEPSKLTRIILLNDSHQYVDEITEFNWNLTENDGIGLFYDSEFVSTARFLNLILSNNKEIICIIHHEKIISKQSETNRQIKFREYLTSLRSEEPDVGNFIKLIEKVIFDEELEIDPEAKRTSKKVKAKDDSKDEKKTLKSLAVNFQDIDQTKLLRRQTRMIKSGDLAYILDLLINRLGADLIDENSDELLDKYGRSEEELIGSDDDIDEGVSPFIESVIKKSEIVKICHNKVRTLINRLSKQLEKASCTEKEDQKFTVITQVLAVIAVIKELIALDKSKKFDLKFQESFVPKTLRMRLFSTSVKYLYGNPHRLLDKVQDNIKEKYESDIIQLKGLLVWLAWESRLDFRSIIDRFHMTVEDMRQLRTERAYMLFVSEGIASNEESYALAQQSLEQTVNISEKQDSIRWLEAHRNLGNLIKKLKNNLPKKHIKMKYSPKTGDLAYVKDSEPADISIVFSSGTTISLIDIGSENGRYDYLPAKIVGIPFKKLLRKL